MTLIIVESPTKAKTLTRFLGSGFHVEATYGHVRDLPQKKLGIEINQRIIKDKDHKGSVYSFVPNYEIIHDRKKRITELKKLTEGQKEIILATDPDREGEAIAFHIKEIINSFPNVKKSKPRISRIVFHEITKSAINHAMARPGEIDERLVSAQTARRLLDRLVGYKLSPLLWNKLGKRWLSAGRVQTVAVRLIVEREREIQLYSPVEYWLIDAEFKGLKDQFIARLEKINNKKAEINIKADADNVLNEIKNADYRVSDIETKQSVRGPLPPFATSTLQQTAVNRFGWSAKKTMRAAQNLYEEGFITYHRTDSTNLAVESITSARLFIEKNFGKSYIPSEIKLYKTKSKVAQEAHEAVRPTNVSVISQSDEKNTLGIGELKPLPPDLGRDAQLLYSLIWRRFLACQMSDAVFNVTNTFVTGKVIDTPGKNEFLFKTSGSDIKFDGWQRLYEKKEDPLNKIPNVVKNEKLKAIKILPQQKFTEPPARFNEASLIKALEEKGIGRPSTYAPIITTIQDRKYVEKIERRFFPTDLGFAVNDFLIKHFPQVFEVTFTAGMENELDEIANGKLDTDHVLNEFYAPLQARIDVVFKEADRVKVDLGTTDEKCPKCSSPLVIRMSKFGKFLACSTFPECKFTKNLLEKAGIECPKCKGDIIVKKTRRGKQFYGCANYPTCNFAAWKKEDIKPDVAPVSQNPN